MTSLEQLLSEHPFFMGIDPRHLHQLSECAAATRFESGEFLFREGEIARAFYAIRSGSIALASMTPHEGPLTIQTLGAGEVLGWSWLLPPYRWHFSARAIEATSLIALDASCVRARAEQDHDFGFEVMRRFAQVMASRLEATHLQLMNVYEHRR